MNLMSLPATRFASTSFRRKLLRGFMSMSKPFVAVGIMILVQERKIPSVDSKVSELPGFQDFPYRDITIKQLLTQRELLPRRR